jgi:CBS domain-containing protein
MATKAREIMTAERTCANETDTVQSAASTMERLGVGALPICGQDNKLKGMITDRDIVIKVVAGGKDSSSVTVGELQQPEAVTIGADDDADEILATMREQKVRRLPVIDGNELVGVIALADVAKALDNPTAGQLVDVLSTSS